MAFATWIRCNARFRLLSWPSNLHTRNRRSPCWTSAKGITRTSDTLAKELSAHALLSAKELKSLTENQQALNDDLMSLKGKCAGEITALQSAGQGMMELVDGLRKQYASATDLLSKRLEHLSEAEADLMRRTKLVETQLADQSSLPGWMKRNAVALIGLVIGALALVQVAVR